MLELRIGERDARLLGVQLLHLGHCLLKRIGGENLEFDCFLGVLVV